MEPSATRGNSADKWNKLLAELDDKLQLGLLDRLRRVLSYHVEGSTMLLEPGSTDDLQYLEKDSVKQQLGVFASSIGVTQIEIKKQ